MRYSFVVPIYNDGHLAPEFCVEFEATFKSHLKLEDPSEVVELIFVNDGSSNDSMNILKEIASKFAFVKVIDFSRNFGQHVALTAGYREARGQFVGMLNVDMEDPPSEIPKILALLENEDFDIVTALRTSRSSRLSERVTSAFFHWLLNKLTGSRNPLNCSTLRIMNRRFVDAYNLLSEKQRYLPGLEFWLGFRHGYVETRQRRRERGRSSYTLLKRLRFALTTILSFSSLPLKFAVMAGFLISTLGFFLGVWLVISKMFFTDYQAGYTSTMCMLMFFGGTQITVTGVVGLYVGRILVEVQNRPLYIVREKLNF